MLAVVGSLLVFSPSLKLCFSLSGCSSKQSSQRVRPHNNQDKSMPSGMRAKCVSCGGLEREAQLFRRCFAAPFIEVGTVRVCFPLLARVCRTNSVLVRCCGHYFQISCLVLRVGLEFWPRNKSEKLYSLGRIE